MERKVIVCPSLLAANFLDLNSDLKAIKAAGIKYLHYDVMDGHFVPNISFGPAILKAIRPFNFVMDVHLMVIDLEKIIPMFVQSGADIITFHLEVCQDMERMMLELKARYPKMKWGISIKPQTAVASVLPYLHLFDLVLVMSVEPGFGGQSFMVESLERIAEINNYIKDNNLETIIEVDGGINEENAHRVIKAGATMIVAGTSIFKSPNLEKSCRIIGGGQI